MLPSICLICLFLRTRTTLTASLEEAISFNLAAERAGVLGLVGERVGVSAERVRVSAERAGVLGLVTKL